MTKDEFTLQFLTNRESLYLSKKKSLTLKSLDDLVLTDITLYHVQEITFEDKAPRREALENVMGALRIEGICFLYLILGTKQKVSFYFGVAKDRTAKKAPPLTIYDMGRFVLLPSLRGNFRGSTIDLVGAEKEGILESLCSMKEASYMEGVPGVAKEQEEFQGVDRLVDVMLGDEFAVLVIAKPLGERAVEEIERNLNHCYSRMVPFVKTSFQEGTTNSKAVGVTSTTSTTETKAESHSSVLQKSTGSNEGETKGTSSQTTRSAGKSETPVSGKETKNTNESGSQGTTSSKTSGTTKGESTSTTKGTSITLGTSESKAYADNDTVGTSTSSTSEFIQKEAQDWVKYLDETLFPRLDYGKGRGVFLATVFLFSNQKGSLLKLENTMKALYAGERGNKVPLESVPLKKSQRATVLGAFQIPVASPTPFLSASEVSARSALSQYAQETEAFLGSWLSTKELSLIAGLPQKEIVGLGLREEVEFGLNYKVKGDAYGLTLGKLVQGGKVLDIPVSIDPEYLTRHTFVTGVTGSGKTTTCQKILLDSGFPFLVVEPAKTEYRALDSHYEDLLLFTLGKDAIAPFRLNPFEFFPHESITSRVDMVKASIEAAFDMEAAIPQLIEAAMYACYKDYGWDISSNKNLFYEDPFADGVYAFPTLSDLLQKTESVVREQGFDARLHADYIGSIRARLQGLTIGSKGLMLDTRRSVDFRELLKKRVVLELEEIRGSAEKSLVMGFVLTNLVEAVKACYAENRNFRHITLIEEAHRLLSKYTLGDSLTKKQSIETFTDMLAEVRKYGEALLISDQIPSKLAVEVLKNTNTKIVHRLFAEDDKEAIGNTMALSREQKTFLSYLDTGKAILFTHGYNKAMHVEILRKTDTDAESNLGDRVIRERALAFYASIYQKGVFLGMQGFRVAPSMKELALLLELNADASFKEAWQVFKEKLVIAPGFREAVLAYTKSFGAERLTDYVYQVLYKKPASKVLCEKRRAAIYSIIQGVIAGASNSTLLSFDKGLL